jgi:hypothetical protein
MPQHCGREISVSSQGLSRLVERGGMAQPLNPGVER